MRISNFRPLHASGRIALLRRYAVVDVTTGIWIWKKVQTVSIFRKHNGPWCFVDSGKPVPAYVARLEVERLVDRRRRHRVIEAS